MKGNKRDCRTCINAQFLKGGSINCQIPFDDTIPIVNQKSYPQYDDDGVFVMVYGYKCYFGNECKRYIRIASTESEATFFLELALNASKTADSLEATDKARFFCERINAKAMAENAVDWIVHWFKHHGSSLNPKR